jgi:hypothetical protein
MIIDLDGYADGDLGRPSQCPPAFDPVSYSSGYREGRANRPGIRREVHRVTVED